MISKFTFSFFIFASINYSCGHEDGPIKSSLYTGETSMVINHDSVTYCTYGSTGVEEDVEGIYIFSNDINGYILTNTLVFFIPGDTGVFSFHKAIDIENRYAQARYYFKDADVLLASYYISEDKANGSVSILHYDPGTGEISGDFNCVLYLKKNYGLQYPPDSLVIEHGHFETFVVD